MYNRNRDFDPQQGNKHPTPQSSSPTLCDWSSDPSPSWSIWYVCPASASVPNHRFQNHARVNGEPFGDILKSEYWSSRSLSMPGYLPCKAGSTPRPSVDSGNSVSMDYHVHFLAGVLPFVRFPGQTVAFRGHLGPCWLHISRLSVPVMTSPGRKSSCCWPCRRLRFHADPLAISPPETGQNSGRLQSPEVC